MDYFWNGTRGTIRGRDDHSSRENRGARTDSDPAQILWTEGLEDIPGQECMNLIWGEAGERTREEAASGLELQPPVGKKQLPSL